MKITGYCRLPPIVIVNAVSLLLRDNNDVPFSSTTTNCLVNAELTVPMRRAAVQAFRSTRRARPLWKVAAGRRPRAGYFSSEQALNLQSFYAGRHASYASYIPASLQSSMHFRGFSVALISTAIASGAWYAYQGSNTQRTVVTPDGTSSSQIRSFTSGIPPVAYAEAPSESTRRALLVHNDQLYTATLTGDQPLSKYTDESDRRILEMLAPEQATQKLRKNEESYLVNRGQGVVRYDIVQVPSNSPIEDDHAEKIVEVPSSVASTKGGEANSDWMFWAIFDGHS